MGNVFTARVGKVLDIYMPGDFLSQRARNRPRTAREAVVYMDLFEVVVPSSNGEAF
jgi:hypothetical protein